MARCTCALEAVEPSTGPPECLKHRGPWQSRAAAQRATPAPEGIPIVNLTALLTGAYERADAHRETAAALDRVAAEQRRTADYLEALAAALSGGVRGE